MRTSRRLRWVLAEGAAVLVAAWLAVGLLPRFEDADMYRYDLETYQPDDGDPFGLIKQSIVVDPSDGSYDGFWTFENAGIAPATVRVGPLPENLYEYEAVIVELDQRTSEVIGPRDAVAVGPDRVFAVEFSLGLGCATMAEMSSTWVSTVPVSVTTLGLTRTLHLALPEPIGVEVTQDYVPPADCDEGPR